MIVKYTMLCVLNFKRDRQCTYNVILRCVHATIVDVEKSVNIKTACVFVALQRARAIFSSVDCPLYSTFPHYLINIKIFFFKKLLSINCVF
jgi:hypothetical protein